MAIKEYLRLYYRFLLLCKPWWRYGVWAGVITLIIAGLQLPMPFLTKYAIDNIFPRKDFSMLNLVVIGLLILLIINTLSRFLNGLLLFLFRTKAIIYIQKRLFEHMEHLSMKFYNDRRIGELVSRVASDPNTLHGLMAETLLGFLRNLFTFLIGIGALFFLHPKLAFFSLLILPFFVYSLYFFSGRIRKKSKETRERIAHVFSSLFETLYSIPVIKSFCLETERLKKVEERLNAYFRSNLELFKLSAFSGSLASFIGGIAPLLILWLGGREIMTGHLTLGGFVAFNAFLGYLYGPVQTFMGLNTAVQTSFASLKRIFEILETPREDAYYKKRGLGVKKIQGHIKYENVTFSYDGEKPALHNISFEIKPKEKIALVGKTGAGKSTIVNLLLRFYEPQAGNIYIDGVNIKEINAYELRKRIGVVLQNTLVLSGTIKDNIKVGNPKASDDEVMEAVKMAGLYEFIRSLPKGLDTEIGERGVKLSGGERQKIAIARVILKNPDILIFDEATSEMDSTAESEIKRAMEKIWKDRTVIFIAHRLFSLTHAQRIIFLENGRILKIGTHEELYKTIPSYRRLYEEQFKEFE